MFNNCSGSSDVTSDNESNGGYWSFSSDIKFSGKRRSRLGRRKLLAKTSDDSGVENSKSLTHPVTPQRATPALKDIANLLPPNSGTVAEDIQRTLNNSFILGESTFESGSYSADSEAKIADCSAVTDRSVSLYDTIPFQTSTKSFLDEIDNEPFNPLAGILDSPVVPSVKSSANIELFKPESHAVEQTRFYSPIKVEIEHKYDQVDKENTETKSSSSHMSEKTLFPSNSCDSWTSKSDSKSNEINNLPHAVPSKEVAIVPRTPEPKIMPSPQLMAALKSSPLLDQPLLPKHLDRIDVGSALGSFLLKDSKNSKCKQPSLSLKKTVTAEEKRKLAFPENSKAKLPWKTLLPNAGNPVFKKPLSFGSLSDQSGNPSLKAMHVGAPLNKYHVIQDKLNLDQNSNKEFHRNLAEGDSPDAQVSQPTGLKLLHQNILQCDSEQDVPRQTDPNSFLKNTESEELCKSASSSQHITQPVLITSDQPQFSLLSDEDRASPNVQNGLAKDKNNLNEKEAVPESEKSLDRQPQNSNAIYTIKSLQEASQAEAIPEPHSALAVGSKELGAESNVNTPLPPPTDNVFRTPIAPAPRPPQAPKQTAPVLQDPKRPQDIYVNGIPYTAISMLGQGGSSVVYQVIDPKTSKLMAIKRVDLKSVDEQIANGYLNEVELLSKLQGCQSVIRMFDHQYVQQHKVLYVVMEKGDVDLARLIKDITKMKKKISMSMVIYYWTEMLNAVKDIHDRGIIHSDLKPSNFLLVSGRLKLIDFGIASSLQGDSTSVVKDIMCGTFNYMSPEAISSENNRSHRISYKSDVWSLGCILYNLVYGRSPYAHVSNMWTKLSSIADPSCPVAYPEDGSFGDSEIPVGIAVALRWSLKKSVKERPTVKQLLDLPYYSPPPDMPLASKIKSDTYVCILNMFPECNVHLDIKQTT